MVVRVASTGHSLILECNHYRRQERAFTGLERSPYKDSSAPLAAQRWVKLTSGHGGRVDAGSWLLLLHNLRVIARHR